MNKTENRKTVEKIHKTKSWFFQKIYENDKPLYKAKKKKRHKLLISGMQ